MIPISGASGLVDEVLASHAGSRGFDSHRGHMSEWFFRSNRPGYPHPVSSELENSGIRVAVGDCSVTERRRWRPPYQTGKTVHVHAKHYKHNEDGRTAPGVCGNGSVPLSHSGNVVTRIGIHTHTLCDTLTAAPLMCKLGHRWPTVISALTKNEDTVSPNSLNQGNGDTLLITVWNKSYLLSCIFPSHFFSL